MMLLIDGNNMAWRATHKLPILTANGREVQLVYGMLKMIRSSIEQFYPDWVMVCWDSGRSKFRQKLYPDYKAHRTHDSTPEEEHRYKSFNKQAKILREVLPLLQVVSMDWERTEGDDLIGIASQHFDGKKIILSGDQDMLHLVDRKVSVWYPSANKLYTHKNFETHIGMTPEQWLWFRALTGDATDGITGAAKGFGPKSAKELLLKYGTLERIYDKFPKLKKRGGKAALIANNVARANIARNLMLMDLKLCDSRPEAREIIKRMERRRLRSEIQGVNDVDAINTFKRYKFSSLLVQYSSWAQPFQTLGG